MSNIEHTDETHTTSNKRNLCKTSYNYPRNSIQRISCKQKNCERPCNSGDTAISEINQQERNFDNIFFPFSKVYNKTNFICRNRNYVGVPIADRGSGALGKVKRCRNRCCKIEHGPNGKSCKCVCGDCPLDGNPNNYTINQFEAGERKFEDQFNPMTDLYLKTTRVCRNSNTVGVPIAHQGTGALNACKIGAKTRGGQCRQGFNNNVASDFCRADWAFDNAIRQTRKCRRNKNSNRSGCKSISF